MSATAARAEVGPMVTGGDVEHALSDTLRDWLPAYLAECERQHDLTAGAIPVPRGWALTSLDLQKLNTDQLPCIVIMAGGILAPPRKEGPPGVLTAVWVIEVGTVFNAAWGGFARQHCQLYAAAVRTCLLQRLAEEQPLVSAVDVIGEVYDEMPFADTRTYSASVVRCNVEVRGIGWASGGPPPPAPIPPDPTSPWLPWLEVLDVDVVVENTTPEPPS